MKQQMPVVLFSAPLFFFIFRPERSLVIEDVSVVSDLLFKPRLGGEGKIDVEFIETV